MITKAMPRDERILEGYTKHFDGEPYWTDGYTKPGSGSMPEEHVENIRKRALQHLSHISVRIAFAEAVKNWKCEDMDKPFVEWPEPVPSLIRIMASEEWFNRTNENEDPSMVSYVASWHEYDDSPYYELGSPDLYRDEIRHDLRWYIHKAYEATGSDVSPDDSQLKVRSRIVLLTIPFMCLMAIVIMYLYGY